MFDAQEDLLDLIANSIIQIYDGDLEKSSCEDLSGAFIYTPLDVDHIRDLLMKHWGEHVKQSVLDDAFERLTEEGAEHWPKAWCEEDEADAADQRLRDIDYEWNLINERKQKLVRELKRLEAEEQALDKELVPFLPILGD
jgi:hypothetical protein